MTPGVLLNCEYYRTKLDDCQVALTGFLRHAGLRPSSPANAACASKSACLLLLPTDDDTVIEPHKLVVTLNIKGRATVISAKPLFYHIHVRKSQALPYDLKLIWIVFVKEGYSQLAASRGYFSGTMNFLSPLWIDAPSHNLFCMISGNISLYLIAFTLPI